MKPKESICTVKNCKSLNNSGDYLFCSTHRTKYIELVEKLGIKEIVLQSQDESIIIKHFCLGKEDELRRI